MDIGNTLAFLVFPYITLTIFTFGHLSRYLIDRYGWNARSSEFLEKKKLFLGATIFHWGILLTLLGHAGGLLTPQRFLDRLGIDGAPIRPSPIPMVWRWALRHSSVLVYSLCAASRCGGSNSPPAGTITSPLPA